MSLDRRQFLTETGRTASASAFGLASFACAIEHSTSHSVALANVRNVSVNEKIAIAMIGVGGRGSGLMHWAASHPAANITTICDINVQNLSRATEAVKNFQGKKPKTANDFRRVLDDDSVDVVFVATPHHWHCPIAIRALDAGKHVYVEKPASHVFREGRLLVKAANRNKRIVQQGTQMRSSDVTAAAAKVLASGILGEIKQSKAWGVEPRSHHANPVPDSDPPEYLDYEMWLGPAPKRAFNRNRYHRWNSYRDYGNGEVGGDGIHDIDMARWGLGVNTHPIRINSHGSRIHLKGESDFPDNMMVSYQYAEDKVLFYENRNFAPYKMHGWDNGNIFYGTEGYMVFSRRGYFQTYLGAKEEKGPGMKGGSGNQEHVHNFLDCVRTGKKNNADAETTHLSCALVHLGEIAYRTGRVLNFDPKTERFSGDAEANALLTKKHRDPWGLAGA